MKLYLRLLKFVKPHRWTLAAAFFCSAMVSLLTAAYAWLVQPVVNDVFIRKDGFMLKILPVAIILVALLKGLFNYGQAYLVRYVGSRIIAGIRKDLYRHIVLLPIGFHAKNATGKLMSRVINDVGIMQTAVSTVVKDLFQQSLTMVALTGVIFYQNWQLGLMAILAMPLATYPLIRVGRRLRKVARAGQEKIGDLTSILQETFSGIRIVKAFGREDFETERFDKKNMNYFKNVMRATSVSELTSPMMETLGSVGAAAIIWYGGYQVITGQMDAGAFFSFMTAAMLMYAPMKGLSSANNILQQALAAAERVFTILDQKNERELDPGRRLVPSLHGEIEFREVSFQYDGIRSAALSNISLKARPGEVIALVGSSGAGKTTLVNMIPRFYEPQGGTILIDGIPIQEINLGSLRSQIGIVSQEVVLFDDTVRWNIAYGLDHVSDEEIVRAAEAAYAHLFIGKMPKGYDTVLEKGGANLSGGERQRLAIARALLKNPPILILDEATSALDAESEFIVQKALVNLMKNRTTFVIAHRLSTVQRATCIIVVDQGRIVEMGRHEDLMQRDGPYRKVYQMQFLHTEGGESPDGEVIEPLSEGRNG
ncbi:lipid A export permease/ATP-binding protein MsbA [Candidatus Manganitrophus noduliformans]|uniref:Lipid A export permease/ATP-binding protein MsbA n=1 Tax=Candidatus Manganitrophus noduliformans TaxID=2606439 RepID=A0A7X6IAW2_9BACT|nr:lipid A export permease/ATP-binding protein MsbA [Candidatus Manganitrophus noduliformans]NKE70988.1 lipid A export permease/ATP-binding protein MsbA [Candidatus Manganitrophus noduliformans]